MFKKIIVLIVCVGLLGQNMLFAQQRPAASPLPLLAVQQQAVAAHSLLMARLPKMFELPAVFLSAVGLVVLTAVVVGLPVRLIMDFLNRPDTEIAQLITKAIDNPAETRGLLKEALIARGYSADEVNAVNAFLNSIQEAPRTGGKLSQKYSDELIYTLEHEENNIKALKKVLGEKFEPPAEVPLRTLDRGFVHSQAASKASKEYYAAIWKRRAIRAGGALAIPIALVMIGVLDANAKEINDTAMAERIAKNPNLFLEATPQEIEQIEKNPAANKLCRDFTDQLVVLSQMPPEELQETLSALQTDTNAQEAKNTQTRELKKSISSLRAVRAH